jgi:xylulokinase
MPPKSPSVPHFLGIELSTEQLRAVVVDEHLDVIVADAVDFDTDLPEYQCVPFRE